MSQYNAYSSAAKFLASLSPGTPNVRFQYDGGGFTGYWIGTYQGIDQQGNAVFSAVSNYAGTAIPGLHRIALQTINSVSV